MWAESINHVNDQPGNEQRVNRKEKQDRLHTVNAEKKEGSVIQDNEKIPSEKEILAWEIQSALDSEEINQAQYIMLQWMLDYGVNIEEIKVQFNQYKGIILEKNFPNG